jgi:4-hydroxyproline epimerase
MVIPHFIGQKNMVPGYLPIRLPVIDSHTGGEPTRCVPAGLFDLGEGTVVQRLEIFRQRYDHYRRAILCEPRGSEVLVGAYLLEPSGPDCAAGVIFFNNAGYLGMCGHGMIGVVATLAYMGKIGPGRHRFETPVGIVEADLEADGRVLCRNVPAYCWQKGVTLQLPSSGSVTGDIAWGGNWFFLVEEHGFQLTPEEVEPLTAYTWEIRQALIAAGMTGKDGAEIDHVELFSPPREASNHSRNFVLCPGKVYDRSPCGTGTSAKMACLAADGRLQPGQIWRQEGILGSVFEGSYEIDPEQLGYILPTIAGTASITAESTLIFAENDPFHCGVPA